MKKIFVVLTIALALATTLWAIPPMGKSPPTRSQPTALNSAVAIDLNLAQSIDVQTALALAMLDDSTIATYTTAQYMQYGLTALMPIDLIANITATNSGGRDLSASAMPVPYNTDEPSPARASSNSNHNPLTYRYQETNALTEPMAAARSGPITSAGSCTNDT